MGTLQGRSGRQALPGGRGAACTYLAMALKAKSTLRPVLALVSMKGSPYSCKQRAVAWGAAWTLGLPGASPLPCPDLTHLGQLLPVLPLHHTLMGRVHLGRAQGCW